VLELMGSLYLQYLHMQQKIEKSCPTADPAAGQVGYAGRNTWPCSGSESRLGLASPLLISYQTLLAAKTCRRRQKSLTATCRESLKIRVEPHAQRGGWYLRRWKGDSRAPTCSGNMGLLVGGGRARRHTAFAKQSYSAASVRGMKGRKVRTAKSCRKDPWV